MRIALISPNFPPDHCGVGDYTAQLARELTELGAEIGVWTSQSGPLSRGHHVETIARPWGRKQFNEMTDAIRNWKADHVILQYSPYLFGRAGIQPLIPMWIAEAKRKLGVPVSVMAHELHYPVGLTPDRLLYGWPQFGVFQAMALASDRVFFANELSASRYCRRFWWRSSHYSWLPVGSNIDVQPADLSRHRLPEDRKLMLHFGSSHPTRLFDHLQAALSAAVAKFGDDGVMLVFAGIGDLEVKRHFKRNAIGLGYVPAAEASALLSRCDLLLAPYLDGVSARRGSVMAALAHQIPVVSTHGWSTDPSGEWDSACTIVAKDDLTNFARLAVQLLTDPERARVQAEAGARVYRERYDWPVIARWLLASLDQPKNG